VVILADLMAQVTLRRNGGANSGGGLSPVAALVRQHDRDRFQTALFAPVADREALFSLYAFNYEIARVRESVREPMLGQIRLQWWREAIEAAYAGTPPRRHEVVEPLTATIRERGLSRAHFERLIDSRESGLDDEAPATLAALEDYAEASSAPLVMLALEVLGAATPVAQEAARAVGIGFALTGIIRALPHAAAAGGSSLPADLPPRDAIKMIATAAVAQLAAARARRGEIPARALPALLPARVATAALRRLERAGFDPIAARLAEHDPLQPWRLAIAALFRRF
jgi:NADH dehydrogenase [ubiquinone] 1 alpha subcomplex assembly factor 6